MIKRIMLNIIALVCLCANIYGSTVNAQISGKEKQQDALKEIPLKEGLSKIRQAFGIRFTYERSIVENIKVSYDWSSIKNHTATEVMNDILVKNGLNYKAVLDNHFIITRIKETENIKKEDVISPSASSVKMNNSGIRDTVIKPSANFKSSVLLSGKVTERLTGKPVESATVTLPQYGISTLTDEAGLFSFKDIQPGKTRLQIQYISMVAYDNDIEVSAGKVNIIAAILERNTLSLREVQVVATESKTGGATSSTINKTAIEHIQATNLGDVLQLLPGALARNPDLTSINRASIRQVNADNNNSLGTAIYINGSPVSNNANLQVGNTATGGANASFSTTTGGGLDLRQFSTDNIESVTVIRGIPSVEYGELTAGAIIITPKSGISPLYVKGRFNPLLTQVAAGKGFAVGRKGATLNADIDYTSAVSDQRFSFQGYDRLTSSMLLAKKFFKRKPLYTKTRFSYAMNIDQQRRDPDDQRTQTVRKAQEYNFGINTSGKWNIQSKFSRTINYNLSVNYSSQQGYYQELISGYIYPMSTARKDTMQEGTYVPSEYLSSYKVDGKPLSINAKISNSFYAETGKLLHRFIMGTEWRTDVNFGNGRSFDELRPPRISVGNGSRPRSYKDIPALNILSFYAEDNISAIIFNRKFNFSAGVRFDNVQPTGLTGTKFNTIVSPRGNISYELFDHFSLKAGYGITAKAPTLVHLYPQEAYFDLLNFNGYKSNPNESLVMVTTRIFNTENKNLKISSNMKRELGFDWDLPGNKRISVTGYYETLRDGYDFMTTAESVKMILQRIDTAISRPVNQKPVLTTNPVRVDTFVADYSMPVNSFRTTNKGIEFDLDFGRINEIRTSFVFNGAYMSTQSISTENYVLKNNTPLSSYLKKTAIYAPGRGRQYDRFSTALRIIHNIPAFRFVVSMTIQTIWIDKNKYLGYDSLPIGYISTTTGKQIFLSEKERVSITSPRDRDELIMNIAPEYYRTESWKPLWLFNIRLTKDIGKYAGFAFIANNVFMSRPLQQSTRWRNEYTRRNQAMFFGAEFNIKL